MVEKPLLPQLTNVQIKEVSLDEESFLSRYIGDKPLQFLKSRGITLHLRTSHHVLFGDIKNYYFEAEGRTIELINSEAEPERIEICYSFTEDFNSHSPDRYDRSGEIKDLQQSMLFIRFMKEFLATFRKDAPIWFKTFHDKRKRLAEVFVNSAKLTHATIT